jgi:hypothetical protein
MMAGFNKRVMDGFCIVVFNGSRSRGALLNWVSVLAVGFWGKWVSVLAVGFLDDRVDVLLDFAAEMEVAVLGFADDGLFTRETGIVLSPP